MRFLAVTAMFLAMTGAAMAGPVEEVRAGVFAQSCCGFGSSKESGAAINGEAAFSSPRFLSVLAAPRPVVGATIATDGDATNQVYAGLEWRVDISKFFVTAGVGGAIHDGEADRYDPVADAARHGVSMELPTDEASEFIQSFSDRLSEELSAPAEDEGAEEETPAGDDNL